MVIHIFELCNNGVMISRSTAVKGFVPADDYSALIREERSELVITCSPGYITVNYSGKRAMD